MGHYLKKLRRYHGECCASGGPKAKTRGAAGPEGFGRGTSRGTTFTMIPPRFFHKMSLLQHPGLVHWDLTLPMFTLQPGYNIHWTPQGVHWTLYWAWTANIGRVKSQYTSPGCYKNGLETLRVQNYISGVLVPSILPLLDKILDLSKIVVLMFLTPGYFGKPRSGDFLGHRKVTFRDKLKLIG